LLLHSAGMGSDEPAQRAQEYERRRRGATPRRRRRRDKDGSRKALLKAAFDLLAEGRHVTTVEVTRRAGLAQSSFYAHFADTDECALAAVREVVERIEEHVSERQGFVRFPPTDREALEAHIAALLGDKDVGDTNPVFTRFKRDPGPIGDVVRQHLGAMRAGMLEDLWRFAVISGVGSEHYAEFAIQADLIVGTIVHASSAIREGRYRDVEQVARVIARNFWAANTKMIRACGGDPRRLRVAFAPEADRARTGSSTRRTRS
jgi:AcrR family transcriptional regulator